MIDIAPRKRAGVYANKDIIALFAESGYTMSGFEPFGKQFIFSHDISDATLGEHLISVLQTSRFLTPQEMIEIFNSAKTPLSNYTIRREAWIKSLMERCLCKTKGILFRNMLLCNIEWLGEFITISPTNHDRVQGWSGDGLDESDDVIISANSPVENIGEALRLGFSRCIGNGAYLWSSQGAKC